MILHSRSSKQIENYISRPTFSSCGIPSSNLSKRLFYGSTSISSKRKPRRSKKSFQKSNQEIEQFLVSTQDKANPKKILLKQSSSFAGISREKRNKIENLAKTLIPGPTHYNPNFQLVKPRQVFTGLISSKSSTKTSPVVKIPQCINKKKMKCQYPHKLEQSQLSLDKFHKTLANVQAKKKKRYKQSKYLRSHVSTVKFDKMSKRKGIPINELSESRFDIVKQPKKHIKSPNFSNYRSHTNQVKLPYTQAEYQVNYESLRRSLVKVPNFTKMKPRFDEEKQKGNQRELDVSKILIQNKPGSRIPTPFMGTRPVYSSPNKIFS